MAAPTMFGAVILAAGASTRFGSPKALLHVGSETAVARASRQLAAAGVDDIVVVVGAHAKEIAPAVPAPARVVVNPNWTLGRTGSVKAGVKDLDRLCCFFVWPVDHPAIATETLSTLIDGPGDIRVPTYEGRRGHPTLFESTLRGELLALRDDQPLHDVLHAGPSRVVEVPVDDPGVLLNVDTPDDLKKLEPFLQGYRHARAPA